MYDMPLHVWNKVDREVDPEDKNWGPEEVDAFLNEKYNLVRSPRNGESLADSVYYAVHNQQKFMEFLLKYG